MSDSQSPNPYQPAAPIESSSDSNPYAGQFRLTARQLRYAESQYLLHWRSTRLVTGSLTLIIVSAIVFVFAMFRGGLLFGIAVSVSVTISIVVYTALIRRDSVQIRRNLQRLGLIDGSSFDIELTPLELIIHTQNGRFQWPREGMKSYRTRKGLLLCPEPLVFLFVPKAGTPTEIYESIFFETFGKIGRQFG